MHIFSCDLTKRKRQKTVVFSELAEILLWESLKTLSYVIVVFYERKELICSSVVFIVTLYTIRHMHTARGQFLYTLYKYFQL